MHVPFLLSTCALQMNGQQDHKIMGELQVHTETAHHTTTAMNKVIS